MNYLAHAYLSFNNPGVLVGNMISDHVKGKTQYDYPADIQVGIKLHRSIDSFTDQHGATKEIARLFKPHYRLYAGAFADVVYDYFLANDKQQFSYDNALMDFTQQSYIALDPYVALFPQKFAAMFPYMVSQNWLYNYQYDWGIQKSFNGLARRAAYIAETEIAFDIFLNNKEILQQQYDEFFPDVKKFAAHTMQELLKG